MMAKSISEADTRASPPIGGAIVPGAGVTGTSPRRYPDQVPTSNPEESMFRSERFPLPFATCNSTQTHSND